MQELSKLLDTGVDLLVPFHDDLVRIIHSELTLFFNALHALFLSLAGLPLPGSHLPGVQPVGTPAALVLLLSRLAQLLSSSAIGKVSAVGAPARTIACASPPVLQYQHSCLCSWRSAVPRVLVPPATPALERWPSICSLLFTKRPVCSYCCALLQTVDSLFPFPDARLDSTDDDAHCFHAHHFSALFSSASERLLQQVRRDGHPTDYTTAAGAV